MNAYSHANERANRNAHVNRTENNNSNPNIIKNANEWAHNNARKMEP